MVPSTLTNSSLCDWEMRVFTSISHSLPVSASHMNSELKQPLS
ncbi:Uncharacterised protein [Mycobacteroides abscessus subsp. abscessus]|nr:Uncharacterised protein [Mycobacteroides abscessus subsp. abscessus]